MDAYERFHKLLKRDFSPVLRADGFKGSGNTFRRLNGERLDIVNVQGSQYGGRCYVNVAVHFLFLPSEGGGIVTDPQKFKEYHCHFRDRLHGASKSDHWWAYGTSDAEAEASAESLIHMYRQRAALFFGKFEPFPDVFERMTPAELEAGDFSNTPVVLTGAYAALTMARIMNHLGHREKCHQFAEVGLRQMGRAVGLKAELEQLRDSG